jgi:hypothetical protein
MASFGRHDLGAGDGPLDLEALTVAMAIAPGVYARNRFFELFKSAEVRRARSRAALVRGIVQHLALARRDGGAGAPSVTLERGAGRVAVRYAVPSLRFERRTELSELEASCLLYLAEKAALPGLAPSASEHASLRSTLLRLSGGEAAMLLR